MANVGGAPTTPLRTRERPEKSPSPAKRRRLRAGRVLSKLWARSRWSWNIDEEEGTEEAKENTPEEERSSKPFAMQAFWGAKMTEMSEMISSAGDYKWAGAEKKEGEGAPSDDLPENVAIMEEVEGLLAAGWGREAHQAAETALRRCREGEVPHGASVARLLQAGVLEESRCAVCRGLMRCEVKDSDQLEGSGDVCGRCRTRDRQEREDRIQRRKEERDQQERAAGIQRRQTEEEDPSMEDSETEDSSEDYEDSQSDEGVPLDADTPHTTDSEAGWRCLSTGATEY